MEKPCEHCGNLFIGKRSDSVYCSSSCRQMAYMGRRLNPLLHEAINGIGNEQPPIDRSGKPSIDGTQQHQEQSIDSSLKKYPSIDGSEKDQEPSINGYNYHSKTIVDRILNKEKTSINNSEQNQEPSIDSLEPDLKIQRQKHTGIRSRHATTNDSEITISDNESEKGYEPVHSPFLTAIADLTNGRNHLSVLNNYLYYHKNAASYEIGLRLKCLTECLLAFSEMNVTELEDLKEVCNAFTLTIGSSYYKRLPDQFPYKSYIVLLRDKLKQVIIENRHAENVRFRVSAENKIELLATRFELSEFFTKTRFCDLNFSE